MTDAPLAAQDAQAALAAAVDASFNCISVEGHTSTNDTVLLLASGSNGQPPLDGASLERFCQALDSVCVELAQQIPADGEGSSHLITIDVQGTSSREEARQMMAQVKEARVKRDSLSATSGRSGARESISAADDLFSELDRMAGKIDDERSAGEAAEAFSDLDLGPEPSRYSIDMDEPPAPNPDFDVRLAELKRRMGED